MKISSLYFSKNAYLVLGLNANADEKAINKRHKDLLNYLQIDEIPEYHSDISFANYQIIRTEENVKDAFLNLSNTKKKIYQFFFWFQLLDEEDEKNFKRFLEGEVNEAIESWSDLYAETQKYSYLKNAFIADLLLFEHQNTINDYGDFDNDAKLMAKVLKLILKNEDFWKEFVELFSQQTRTDLPDYVLKEFKNELPQHLAEMFFDLSTYLKKPILYTEYSKALDIHAKEFENNREVIKSIKKIENNLSNVDKRNLGEELDVVIDEMNGALLETKKLDEMGLNNNPRVKKLKGTLSKKLRSMSISLYNDFEDPYNALVFSEEALLLTQTDSDKQKVKKDVEMLLKYIDDLNKYGHPDYCWNCKVRKGDKGSAYKINLYKIVETKRNRYGRVIGYRYSRVELNLPRCEQCFSNLEKEKIKDVIYGFGVFIGTMIVFSLIGVLIGGEVGILVGFLAGIIGVIILLVKRNRKDPYNEHPILKKHLNEGWVVGDSPPPIYR